MAINWEEIRARHDVISQELMMPSLDNTKRIALQKEHSSLSAFLSAYTNIQKLEASVTQTKKAAAENSDVELAQLYQEEFNSSW